MSSSFTLLTFAQHREYTIPDIIRDMKYNHIDTYRDKKYAWGIFKLWSERKKNKRKSLLSFPNDDTKYIKESSHI